MEIERKFLPSALPFCLSDFKHYELEQAYISTNPVIRVRKKLGDNKEAYILTVKSSGMLARQEFELPLEKDSYDNLLTKAEGNVISKTRYIIPLNNDLPDSIESKLVLELDVFHGAFEGLVMGEIEFPDEATAKKYTPPTYLAEEVTYDTHFHNSTLCKMSDKERLELISRVHGNHSL